MDARLIRGDVGQPLTANVLGWVVVSSEENFPARDLQGWGYPAADKPATRGQLEQERMLVLRKKKA